MLAGVSLDLVERAFRDERRQADSGLDLLPTRLARLIGGDITVESELGRGSVFKIWLPVDPADLREGSAA